MRVLRSRTTERVSALAVSDALERELVTAHRDELAEILRQACRTMLLEGERERLFVMRYRTAVERVDPVSRDDIEARIGRVVALEAGTTWDASATSIASALTGSRSRATSVPELAALGERLQPGDHWRVLCAMSHLAGGREELAQELAEIVLAGWPHIDHTLRSLEIVAICTSLGGDPSRALALQEDACALRSDYPIGQSNRLRFALLSLRERPALESSDRLEELLDV